MPNASMLAARTLALTFLPGYGLLLYVRTLSGAERIARSGCIPAAICGIAALRILILAVGIETSIVLGFHALYLSIGYWQANPNTVILGSIGERMLSSNLGQLGVGAFAGAVSVIAGAAVFWIQACLAPQT